MATNSGGIWYSMMEAGMRLHVTRLCGACNLLYESFDPGEDSLRLNLDHLGDSATSILYCVVDLRGE